MNRTVLGCCLAVAVLAVAWLLYGREGGQGVALPPPDSDRPAEAPSLRALSRRPTGASETGTGSAHDRPEVESHTGPQEGQSLSGSVVDPAGRPVAQISLIASLKGGGLGIARRVSPRFDAKDATQTDDGGRFKFEGLSRGSYRIFSTSPEWVIERKPGAFVHQTNRDVPLRLVAYRAWALTLELSAAEGEEPPGVFRCEVDCGIGYVFHAEGYDSRAQIAWRPRSSPDEFRLGLRGSAVFHAVGWESVPQEVELIWEPNQPSLHVEIRVRRVPTGTVQIHAVTPGGSPPSAALSARLRRADTPGANWQVAALSPDVGGRGAWRLVWSTGEWDIRVPYDRGWFGHDTTWSGRVSIRENRTTSLSVQVTAAGALSLVRRRPDGWVFLQVHRLGPRPRTTSTLVEDATYRIPAMPVGEYEATLWAPDDAGNVKGTKLKTLTFRIEQGATTEIELE